MNGQYPNIVWLLVDSVRTYPTDEDVRGLLPMMEEFGRESVAFTSCVTTAPSTIMSVTAMMTGLPAYFIARNYDDFRFDNRRFPSLAGILEQHGYQSTAFLRGEETRLKLGQLVPPLSRDFWPSGLKRGLKWSNVDLNRALDRWVDQEFTSPQFVFFHFNPQTRNEKKELVVDADISGRVAYALQRLREAGFTPDNTVTILCSDHGFPDPAKGMTSEWERRNRLSHDLILTDDNILIPLYVQVPGGTPGIVEAPVGSLDLFPTVLDLSGVPNTGPLKAAVDGRSLAPLIADPGDAAVEWTQRSFRCDARLMFQTGRATAIRGDRFKYIRRHDEYAHQTGGPGSGGEVLLDMVEDPEEIRNLLGAAELSARAEGAHASLRAEMDRTEQRALEYQVDYLLSKQSGLLKWGESRRVLLMFEPQTAGLRDVGLQAVSRSVGAAAVDVATAELYADGGLEGVRRDRATSGSGPADTPIDESPAVAPVEQYDLCIVFVQDPSDPVARSLVAQAAEWGAPSPVVLDCNFNKLHRNAYWTFRVRSFLQRVPLFMEEPGLFIRTMSSASKVIVRQVARRLGIWDRWSGVPDGSKSDVVHR